MLQLKRGISIKGISANLMPALIIANEIFSSIGKPLVITSLLDGEHMINSKHYIGDAMDIRIFHLNKNELKEVLDSLRSALFNSYNIILEKDHIHIELDEN